MQKKIRQVALLSLFLLITVVMVGATPLRAETIQRSVAAFFTELGNPSPEYTGLLLVKLTEDKSLFVIDPFNLQHLLEEQELSHGGLSQNSSQRLALGKLAGAEFVLEVDLAPAGSEGTLRVTHAASGVIVDQEVFGLSGKTAVARINEAARRAAARLTKSMQKVSTAESGATFSRSVAVLLSSNATGELHHEEVLRGMFALQGALAKAGYLVLNRQQHEDLGMRAFLIEKGFLTSESRFQFLGAKNLLIVHSVANSNRKILSVVDSTSGKPLLRRIVDDWSPESISEMSAWFDAVVGAREHGEEPSVSGSSGERFPVEALRPFLLGLRHFASGFYFKAIESFELTLERVPDFLWGRRWLFASYTQAGFPEIAEALKRCYESDVPLETEYSSSSLGFMLLADQARLNSSDSTRLVRLTEFLHSQKSETLLFETDTAMLGREYDVLIGLENATGVLWKQAPNMLPQKYLYVSPSKSDSEQSMDLVFLEGDNPESIQRVSFPYPFNQTAETLLRTLSQQKSKSSLQRNAELQQEESSEELLVRLEEELRQHDQYVSSRTDILRLLYSDASKIKFMSRYPGWLSDVRFRACYQTGLVHWMLRTLPAHDQRKPLLGMLAADAYRRGGRDHDYWSALASLAKKYPDHVVGYMARANQELRQFTGGNSADVAGELTGLLGEARESNHSLPPHILDAVLKWRDVFEAHSSGNLTSEKLPGIFSVHLLPPRHRRKARLLPVVEPLSESWLVLDEQGQSDAQVELLPFLWRGVESPRQLERILELDSHVVHRLLMAASVLQEHMKQPSRWEQRSVAGLLLAYVKMLRGVFREPNPPKISTAALLVEPVQAAIRSPATSAFQSPALVREVNGLGEELRSILKAGTYGTEDGSDIAKLCLDSSGDESQDFRSSCRRLFAARLEDRDHCSVGTPLWQGYIHWELDSGGEKHLLPLYRKHYRRCFRQYQSGVGGSEQVAEFALHFLASDRFRLADESFQFVAERAARSGDTELEANAYYRLALLRLRDMNDREALAMARKAQSLVEGKAYHLLSSMRSWKTHRPLEDYVTRLLEILRGREGWSQAVEDGLL